MNSKSIIETDEFFMKQAIALSALADGHGNEPFGAMLATIVFGFAQAFGIKLSSIGLDSNLSSPIPYIITIIGLVVFAIIKRKRDAKRVATVGAKQRKEK